MSNGQSSSSFFTSSCIQDSEVDVAVSRRAAFQAFGEFEAAQLPAKLRSSTSQRPHSPPSHAYRFPRQAERVSCNSSPSADLPVSSARFRCRLKAYKIDSYLLPLLHIPPPPNLGPRHIPNDHPTCRACTEPFPRLSTPSPTQMVTARPARAARCRLRPAP